VIDTGALAIDEAVAELVAFAEATTALKHPRDATDGPGDGI
jgi:bifunctional enzyme CysN/CysC